ncbi:MAG: extracellular solute-binding protein [Lachnospiraceae bacterium]|nr:extracellular solute-binding protein [Lachnospiraceae bacterium]
MILKKIRNKKKHSGENKSNKKMLSLCLVLAMLMGMLVGCGNSSTEPSADGTGAASVDGEAKQADAQTGSENGADGEGAGSEPAAMGRYVETTVDISENSSRPHNITALADGRLLILDDGAGQLISSDGGETWDTVPIPGIDNIKSFAEENYIHSMAAAPDGTVAVVYSKNGDFEETGTFHPSLHVAKRDGTVQTLDTLPVPEEDSFVYNIYYSPEGELFATVIGTGKVYRVDVESGTLTKALSSEWRTDLIKMQGDHMFFLTSGEGISIYDRKQEKWVEDSVLSDFMEENYKGQYFTGGGYTAYMAPGEDGALYIAGKGGMYRHVIGGSAMEQIIDGALTSFCNPSMSLQGFTVYGENEFAALFSGKVALYRYDPSVPTVPENMVSVYSLQEQDAVRQAIAQFQVANPDIFVRYEVGLSGTDAKAREDAVKKLNTELMAGKGPDVIIMDGLPVKSYEEKGILKDLKPHIESLTADAVLLPNIVEAFNQGGSVYMMPVTFTVPMVIGRENVIEGITDYASLADAVEKVKTEHPEAKVCSYFSEEAAVRWLLPVAATAFIEESGDINREALTEYLSLTERMYKASLEGISDFAKESMGWQKENYLTNSWAYENFNSVGQDYDDFLLQDMELNMGMLKNIAGYRSGLSLKYKEGFADVTMKSFDGMRQGVFEPSILVGLTVASSHQEEAERFFDVLMGTEVQSLLYDGFMVNQTALKSQMSPQWGVFQNAGYDVDYGEPANSVGGSYGDGREFVMDIYVPTREEYQTLYDLCCQVKTPYVEDPVVESAVTECGAQYLAGHKSLEETVNNIVAKVEIYMAE